MPKVFHFYADPGHGWLRVNRELLSTLKIASDITRFSYQRADYVYLEEDCDAGTFIRAYVARYGIEPVIRSHHSNRESRIRSYDWYRPLPNEVAA